MSCTIESTHQALEYAWNFQNTTGFMAGHIVPSYLHWEVGEHKTEQWEEISKPTQNNSEGFFRDAPAISLNYGWIWLATCAFPRGVFRMAENPLSALLSLQLSFVLFGFSVWFGGFCSFSSNSFHYFCTCPSQWGSRVTAGEFVWKTCLVETWSFELFKLGWEDGILLGAILHRPKNCLDCSSSL